MDIHCLNYDRGCETCGVAKSTQLPFGSNMVNQSCDPPTPPDSPPTPSTPQVLKTLPERLPRKNFATTFYQQVPHILHFCLNPKDETKTFIIWYLTPGDPLACPIIAKHNFKGFIWWIMASGCYRLLGNNQIPICIFATMLKFELLLLYRNILPLHPSLLHSP